MHNIYGCLKATSHVRLKARGHCILGSLVSPKTEAVQVPFTLEGEGLRTRGDFHGCKVYMHFYMVNYEYCFMGCWNLHKVHLQEIGLMQIPAYHVSGMVCDMRIKGPHYYMLTALGS